MALSDKTLPAPMSTKDFIASIDSFARRIYDILPADDDCQRLFLSWRGKFKALGKLGRPATMAELAPVSRIYSELVASIRLEDDEAYKKISDEP